MAVTPEQFKEMERRLEAGRAKRPVPPMPTTPVSKEATDVGITFPSCYHSHEFDYVGRPIGKPRMTRRDKFAKRECVLKYWAFKDAIREAAGRLPEKPDMVMVTAWVAMPESWSAKKKALNNRQPCRNRPDWDNIGKAVCDALFDEDCCIWAGAAIKYWCFAGYEKVNVKVFYAES